VSKLALTYASRHSASDRCEGRALRREFLLGGQRWVWRQDNLRRGARSRDS
jgi:hypothetical protein